MLIDMIEERRAAVSSGITLAEAIDRFQVFNRSEGKSPRTIDNYDHRLSRLCGAFGEDFPMKDLDEFALRKHMAGYTTNSRTGAPLRPWTINGHARALRAFFRWAYHNGLTHEHLLARYRPPKVPQEIVDTLSDEEITALLGAAGRRKRDLAIVTMMLDTGVRAAELCGVTVGDVDLNDNTVKVMGKGRKERLVPFGRKARKALVDYARVERPDAGREEAVFLSSTGHRLRPDSLRLLMRRLRSRSGIKRLHPHLLRHTFATRFLLNGGDALMLKYVLGHSTLAMTDRYVHFANARGVAASREFSPVDHHAESLASPATTTRRQPPQRERRWFNSRLAMR